VTEEAIRTELNALALKIERSTTQQETWAKTHERALHKLDRSVALTNTALHSIGQEVAVIQGKCVDRGKRISDESTRVDKLEERVRTQENTGVHGAGKEAGRKAAVEATRKGFLFAFAVLGAIGCVGGMLFVVLRFAGYGG